MSIIPSEANSPGSSRFVSSPYPNPSFDHGSTQDSCRSVDLPHEAGAGDREVANLAEIAGKECPEAGDLRVTESLVAIGEGSSKFHSVAELRSVESKGSNDPKSGGCTQDHFFRGNISSCRADRNRFSKHRGNASGAANPMHSHRFTAGPRAPQSNTSQSGTRKNQIVNANHLLNFYYDPIQRSQPRTPPLKRQQKVRPFNRDLFLQANYKFVVLDTGDYVVDSMDPDKMLQWENVICVRYTTPSPVQCPICLETPLCPQITSCGHIYCFPCILRYLLMGEEDHKGECWKKCPLCFMMISMKDLYTILIEHVKQFDVGDRAHFTLMTRPKNSFVPSQVNVAGADMKYSESGSSNSFSKFTLTRDVAMSVREVKSNLDEWLAKAEFGLVDDLEKLPYVCAALEQLEQRAKDWDAHQGVRCSPVRSHSNQKVSQPPTKDVPHHLCDASISKILRNESVMIDVLNNEKLKSLYTSVSDSEAGHKGPEKMLLADKEDNVESPSIECRDGGDRDAYLFYQVIDGQHLILHPLNMKCLLHHYKNYDMLPQRISGKILQLETVTQSEATRRRYRFLSHFSLTTSFQLCEIDLNDMLPSHAFSPFVEEIKKREKNRKQVARKERELKVQSEPSVPYETFNPSQRRTFENDTKFTLDEFEALGSGIPLSMSPPITSEKKLFSDVTRLGFAASHDSPSLSANAPADCVSSIEGGVSSIITGPSTCTLSFANILSVAKTVGCQQDAPTVNASGKKGKKPPRVLLSTAGGRRY